MHHFVGADNSCISWGHAQYGELGYGPHGQKYVTLTGTFNNYNYKKERFSMFLLSPFFNVQFLVFCYSGPQLYPKRWIFLMACMLLGEFYVEALFMYFYKMSSNVFLCQT